MCDSIVSKTLVTVGVTSFNAENTIARAIISVINQTWRPIEIIVIDDCSSDGTYKVLKNLSKDNPEIKVFLNEINSGVAFSRNRILEEASGEFVIFFDDDDESSSDRIVSQLQRLIDYEKQYANGAPVICHTARKILYPDGEIRIEPTMGQTTSVAPSGISVAKRILLGTPLKNGYGSCPTCSQMARLSTYRLLGGFDPSFRRSEDTDFNIRLALAGGHFVGISIPLVTQTMTKTPEKSIRDEYRYARFLLDKHKAIMGSQKLFDFCCEWLKLKQTYLESNYLGFMAILLKLVFTNPFLVLKRLYLALPNMRINRSFRRFHDAGIDLKKL